jgi:hypothetical protein
MKTNQMVRNQPTSFGVIQVGIIILTLITAFIHLVVLNVRGGRIDVPFVLNGLGSLAFLGALYLPLPFFKENRNLVRWAFIGFTILTILVWVAIGDKSWPAGALGYLTKLDEVLLVILLWLEGRK